MRRSKEYTFPYIQELGSQVVARHNQVVVLRNQVGALHLQKRNRTDARAKARGLNLRTREGGRVLGQHQCRHLQPGGGGP